MSITTGTKIVMVGGGSYNWMPRILSDLMREQKLTSSEIVLLDPNLKAAKEVCAAAQAMSREFGGRHKVTATKDESSAFRGADFVVITISTGDLEMMKHDLKIPEKYGIFATVGDTVGPGGWSRTLRNVPVFAAMVKKIEKLSPHAVILNYTNPMAALTATACQASSLRTVGLCHGVFSTYKLLEKIFGVEENDLSLNFAGVNHFFWVLDFSVKGKPGYDLLRRKLKTKTIDDLLPKGSNDTAGFHSGHALCDELYRAYGYLSYAGDRHTCEFFPQYLTPRPSVLKKFKLARTTVEDRHKNRAISRQRTLHLAAGKEKPFPRSRETAVDIIMAFSHGKAFNDVVNLPNIGQIDNLPRGAVVETLGRIDGLGFRPITAGSLPENLRRIVEPHCIVQMMTVEAALTGNRELALQSLMLDPLCSHLTSGQVREMGEQLIAATKAWLPRFK
jgi:alpha-galactosidase